MSFLDKIFLPKRKSNEFTFERYLEDLDAGTFRDRMCLGVCEANGGSYLLKQFSIEPNALYVGAMGSGKSVAACFSLITWMLSNSDQTILFVVDAVKGANDYKALWPYTSQVYPVLSSENGIIRVIDLIYREAMQRREIFNSVKAESINAYEKITGKKMARVILMMEEFHSIPYAILNFDRDFKTPNTPAFKFHQIMRIGRTMGTWVMAASQKSTKSDIPPEIVPNFTQKQIFRVSRQESAYVLGDSKAADIRSDQKGRCETDYGAVQFPYMSQETQVKLLAERMQPLTAECAYLKDQVIKDYIEGKSNEELYRLQKLPDLVSSIASYDAELVIRILHKRLNHTVESVNSMTDNHGISHVVTWPNGVKVAIMIRVGDKVKVTQKHVQRLESGLAYYGCSRGIIYTSVTDIPSAVYRSAVDAKMEVVDEEDLLRLARQIEDNMSVSGKIHPVTFSPDHLADPAKESGEYQKEHEKLNPSHVVAVKPLLEELIPNNIIKDIPNITPAPKEIIKLKRIPVRMSFLPKKEDNLILLVRPQKTKSGEIFRVLFYVLQDHNTKYNWYVDKKITGILDEDTATALDVGSVAEWNQQIETLVQSVFEQKVLDYFNNFKVLNLPPIVATRDEHRDWVSSMLKQSKHMMPKPTIIEENLEAALGITKDQIEKEVLPQIIPEKKNMFYDIETDKLLWKLSDMEE
jgi:hypothetical protein